MDRNQNAPFWDFVSELNEQGPAHPWVAQGRGTRRGQNANAPFWDFVTELNEQGKAHPWFAQRRAERRGENRDGPFANDNESGPSDIWTGTMPFRGWRGYARGNGLFDRKDQDAAMADPASETETAVNNEPGPATDAVNSTDDTLRPPHGGRHGHGARRGWGMGGRGRGHAHGCGRGRGGMGGPRARAAEGHEQSDNERTFPEFHRGGHMHGRGRGGAWGRPRQVAPATGSGEEDTGPREGKFRPGADVFDHPEAYIVHVSLPGAKKKDVEVNWEAEKSALHITGTVDRPVDAEVLETLVMHERKVGAFERRVRLGNKNSPAQVDVDGITAKIEDGILRIEVPKLDSGFVEIKKVDVA